MPYDCDVHYTPVKILVMPMQSMSRLRFNDYEDELVAVATATFEKLVIDAEKLRK